LSEGEKVIREKEWGKREIEFDLNADKRLLALAIMITLL
jgi:hypothetical protein